NLTVQTLRQDLFNYKGQVSVFSCMVSPGGFVGLTTTAPQVHRHIVPSLISEVIGHTDHVWSESISFKSMQENGHPIVVTGRNFQIDKITIGRDQTLSFRRIFWPDGPETVGINRRKMPVPEQWVGRSVVRW